MENIQEKWGKINKNFDELSKKEAHATTTMPLNSEQYDRMVNVLKDEWNSSGGSPISNHYIEDLTEELCVLCPPRDFDDIPYLYTRDKLDSFKEYAYERCISLKRTLFEKNEFIGVVLGDFERTQCLRFEEKVLKRVNEHLLHSYIEMHILSGYECTDKMMMDIHKYVCN